MTVWDLLTSFGGGALGGAFIIAVAKHWLDSKLETHRAEGAKSLAEVSASLQRENERVITRFKTEMEIFRDKALREHHDKLQVYRAVVDIVAGFLTHIELAITTQKPIDSEAYRTVNSERMRAYGYLAMMAPQEVMDAFNSLTDDLIELVHGKLPNGPPDEWKRVRNLVTDALNTIRSDLGIDSSPIEYRGKR